MNTQNCENQNVMANIELKVLENNVGCYNLAKPNEPSFRFSAALINEKREIIIVEGIRAMITYSGNPEDEDNFNEPIKNLVDIFWRCFNYANHVWGSIDYRAQCLTFANVYQANYEEINREYMLVRKALLQKEISRLQDEFEETINLPNIKEVANEAISTLIAKIEKKIKQEIEQLNEYKEESVSYLKCKKYIEDCNTQKKELMKYFRTV